MKTINSLSKNLSSLFIVQLSNYIIPLISIPVIARIVGPDKFGVINYSTALVGYFVLLINYSFDFTATRQVVQNPNSKENIDKLFSEVLFTKALLLTVSTILFGLCILFSENMKREYSTNIYTFIICISYVLTPNWLYQGMQEISKVAIFNFCSKIIFTIVILLIVKNKEDYPYQPLALSITQIIVAIFSFKYALKRYNVSLEKVSFRTIWLSLKINRMVFFSTLFTNSYTTSNIIILGALSNENQLGYYTAAQKIIVIAMMIILIPISQALFPFIGKHFSKGIDNGLEIVRRVIPLIGILTLLAGVGMFIVGEFILPIFYGAKFQGSIICFRILSLVPFAIGFSNILGVQVLVNLKLDRLFFKITLLGSIFSIIASYIFILMYGAIGASISWLLTEFFVTALMFYYLYRKSIKVFDFNYLYPKELINQLKIFFVAVRQP